MSLWHNENIFVILQSGFWVMGDRCWVLAVTIERKKSPFKGDLEGLQVRYKSVSNPFLELGALTDIQKT